MKPNYENLHCELIHVHQDIVEKATRDMPDEDVLIDLSERFKVLGDSTRIRILCSAYEHILEETVRVMHKVEPNCQLIR